MAGHVFNADGAELALATSKSLVDLQLRVR